MHVIQHLCFFSILSLSLAAAPSSCGRHGSLQARGGLPSKNCLPWKKRPVVSGPQVMSGPPVVNGPPVVSGPPIVKWFDCSGPAKHDCKTHCYCNQLGKVVCDKGNPYSKLFTLKFCAPECSCVVDGVRIPGVWDRDHQKALELEIYNSLAGARAYEAKMKVAKEAYLRESGGTGQPSAEPSKAGDPGAGPSTAGGFDGSNSNPPSFANQPFAPNVDKGLDGSNKKPPTIVSHPSAFNIDAGLGPSTGGNPGAGSSNAGPSTERQRPGSRKFGEPGAGPLHAGDPRAGPSHAEPSLARRRSVPFNVEDPGAGASDAGGLEGGIFDPIPFARPALPEFANAGEPRADPFDAGTAGARPSTGGDPGTWPSRLPTLPAEPPKAKPFGGKMRHTFSQIWNAPNKGAGPSS